MTDPRPIGVFDSGVGGLSVLQEIGRQLPHEDVVYYADAANWPYGEREPGEVRRLAARAAKFLLEREAKLIVVACNTATTVAIRDLRAHFPVPFVGMEPAVKPAVGTTRSGTVGVLATAATLRSRSYAALVARVGGGVTILANAVPGLVKAVEHGRLQDRELEDVLHAAIDPMVASGADTLVLGCTHFPFARETIQRVAGPDIAVIDSGEAVVRQIRRLLAEHGIANDTEREGRVELIASGDYEAFAQRAERLLGHPVAVIGR